LSQTTENILPANNGQQLGTPDQRWTAYLQNLDVTGATNLQDVAIAGNLATSGQITGNITGNVTGNVTGDVVGNVTGNLTGNVTGSVVGNVTGDVTSAGTSSFATANVKVLNAIRYADQFPGATADVKINAAIADLPSEGGTVDCRGFGATQQTIAATVEVGLNVGTGKTVTLLVDRTTTYTATITDGTPAWKLCAGSSIIGMGTVPNPNAGFTLSASANVSNVLLKVDDQGLNLVGGLVQGLFIYGHAGAVVTDAIFGIQNALQITQVSEVTVFTNGTNNTVGLKVYATAGAQVGNVQFNNIVVDTLGSTGSYPVWIGCAAQGSLTPVAAAMNTVTFLGASALVHPSPGNPIVTIESRNGAGGTSQIGNIGFYGTQLESSSGTDIGIFCNGAESLHIYGVYGSVRDGTTPGTDLIKLSSPAGTLLDGVDIRGVDNQGLWTNTLNNTVTTKTYSATNFPRLNYSYSTLSRVMNVAEGGANQVTGEILTAAAPTVAAGQVGLGSTVATTVGAAGGASALPATPTGYLIINVAGTAAKIPYYAS
jgi:hypothetical protein